jgi:hypothetical protein
MISKGKLLAWGLRNNSRRRGTGDDETMTPQQVALIQESWRKVLPISDTAAELFYSRLFTLDPTLKQGLGDAFDEDTERAWVAAYGQLAGIMQGKVAVLA